MCVPFWYPSWWACAWVCGWGTGWLQGRARAANSLWREPTCRIRTPLLRLQVSLLKPNPHAGQRKPYEMRGGHLHLVRPE